MLNTKPFYLLFAAVVFVISAFFPSVTHSVHAVAETELESFKLQSYIDKVCKKDCIDASLLLLAVTEAANEFNVNPLTLLAIILTESGFRPKAVNRTSGKSVGLSQIQVYWHRDKFTTVNHFDVFDNVRVGAMIYRDCVKKWKGSKDKALWCYNGHQKTGMKKYVPKVMKTYYELNSLSIRI